MTEPEYKAALARLRALWDEAAECTLDEDEAAELVRLSQAVDAHEALMGAQVRATGGGF